MHPLKQQSFILDCTLRDGNYVGDGFDDIQTYSIAQALDEAGIHFIEVGHGLGLGAYRDKRYKAICEDAAYMEAAASAVKSNKWGMFFIPGIGKMSDIDLVHTHGMHFIRIGVNVNEWEQALLFIDKAKALD